MSLWIKTNIKRALILTFVLFFSFSTYGQGSKEAVPSVGERLFFGGNLGLQFGTITDIEVSPIVGYWILPRINVAMGPQYRFYKYNDVKANIYGGKAYTELYLIQDLNNFIPLGVNIGLFIHLEDEFLIYNPNNQETANQTLNTILFGGGISQPISINSSANIIALWAIGGNGYEYYGSPEIRIVFIF